MSRSPGAATHISRTAVLAAVVTLAGCASCLSNRGTTAWRLDAPLRGSPATPLLDGSGSGDQNLSDTSRNAAGRQDLARPVAPADARPADGPSHLGPEVTVRQRLDAPAPGPLLPAAEGTGETGLTIRITAPETVIAGEVATLQAAIANRSAAGVVDVELTCEFDDGLAFPGSTDRRVTQSLGALAAGAVRTIPLTLEALQPGTACATFHLSGAGHPTSTRQSCLQVMAPSLAISSIGPTERCTGQRAEFVITIVNHDTRDFADARLTVEYPDRLTAREASAGVVRQSGRLRWDLRGLAARERVQVQVEFECLTPGSADLLVRLDALGATAAATSPLSIRPLPQPLAFSLSDLTDPVAVGDDVQYRIDVVNSGAEPVHDWELRLLVGEALQPGGLTTVGAPSATPPSMLQQGGVWVVRDLPDVPPGETLRLQLPARAMREGTASLEVRLKVAGEEVLRLSEPTVIDPPSTDLNAGRPATPSR